MQLVDDIRPARPADLELLSAIPGLMVAARDEQLRLFWCTPEFEHLVRRNGERPALNGTTHEDILAPTAARDRAAVQRRVIETGRPASHFEFLNDTRLRSTVLPLDSGAFGHAGVLVVIKDAPYEPHGGLSLRLPLIASPALGTLVQLSSRELQVLYYIASGMTTNAIAASVSRSSKTIEKQINSIHTKLRTGSRAELVRFASERGIQSFSEAEWMQIVEGARVTRREMETRR